MDKSDEFDYNIFYQLKLKTWVAANFALKQNLQEIAAVCSLVKWTYTVWNPQ